MRSKERYIWSFEWDICCILDACRVDTFKQFFPHSDSYWSVASTSDKWIKRTFESIPDNVGYISANPFSSDVDADKLEYFHQEKVQYISGVETVPPQVLTKHAISAYVTQDIERLVIHYMQPHVPFRSRPGWFEEFLDTDTWGSLKWEKMVKENEVSVDEWMKAYTDNLLWVLEDGIVPLVNSVSGSIMLTADHGNLKGEDGHYGHPAGVETPELRKVPKFFIKADGDIESVDKVKSKRLSDDQLAQQLKALGYKI